MEGTETRRGKRGRARSEERLEVTGFLRASASPWWTLFRRSRPLLLNLLLRGPLCPAQAHFHGFREPAPAGRLFEDPVDELVDVEWLEVVDLFADAHELDRYGERVVDRDDHAALRGAVELRQDEPGDLDLF